ncbi:MAG: sugar ABC transporter substrate-binding protein [Abditibacteriota bacterium]|nr:sugar ABC transporter substrate-binding protein [Abditibacteriota bacterium]
MKRIILILAALCVLLCGCGKNEQVVLRMVCWGNSDEEKILKDDIAEFERIHPNIRVELEMVAWGRIMDKLMIATAGGQPPDVTKMSSEWFVPLAAKGTLLPLDDLIKRDSYDIEDFYESALEGWGRYKGVTYCIPTDIDGLQMYYNKKMFDEAGIPYPDGSWTWDEYLAICEKLTRDTDGDGRIDRWGGYLGPTNWARFIFSYGGSFLTEDNTRSNLKDPKTVAGLRMMTDMALRHRAFPKPEDTANTFDRQMFANGKIATCVTGCWAADLEFTKTDFDFDVASMPKGPAGRAPWRAGCGFSALSRTHHPDEAWLLVRWMCRPERQIQAAQTYQTIPSRKSVTKEFLKIDRRPHNKTAYIEAIESKEKGWRVPQVSCAPEITTIMNSTMEKVFTGKITLDEGIDEAVPLINKFLKGED